MHVFISQIVLKKDNKDNSVNFQKMVQDTYLSNSSQNEDIIESEFGQQVQVDKGIPDDMVKEHTTSTTKGEILTKNSGVKKKGKRNRHVKRRS